MAYQDSMAKTGLWTPNLQINGSSTGISYATQTGGYTQIGNVVFITVNLQLTNKGASSGSVTISNLPVTSSSDSNDSTLAINVFNGFTLTSYTSLAMQISASSTVGTILASGQGQSAVTVNNTQIGNGFQIVFSGFYIVD